MKPRIIALLLGLILFTSTTLAQDNELLKQIVPLKAGTYTLEQLFDKIDSLKTVNLTYNARDIPLQQKLVIKKKDPTLKEILDQIVKETALEYKILNRYIILKKKKLASTYNISGQVLDAENNGPMIGVNVFLKENNKGTVTDDQGNFVLEIPPGNYILVFSFLGYEKKEVPVNVNADHTVRILMKPSNTAIKEIQINGQRKFFGNMDYGRDIPSIDAKSIEGLNENNASDILHGTVAGVWATKTSGAPGDHEKVRIRGQNSFFSSVEPLYVIDGVPVPIVNLSSLGIADLNIHDIAGVTILKDASSTSLYGFQGGNGVVLIDTKQGGEKSIDFMVKTGVQWFNNFYDMMSSKDFIASLDSAYLKMGIGRFLFYPRYSDTLCSTNWQKQIFRPGLSQEYELSGSGTKNKLKYYVSGNYSKQSGILPNSSYNRYTFTTRLSRSFGQKLALGISYRGSAQHNLNNLEEYSGNPLLFEGISKYPCLKCTPDSLIYDLSGMLIPRIYYNYFPLYDNTETADSIIKQNSHKLTIYSNAASFFARLQFTPHISMDAMESFMYRRSRYATRFSDYTPESLGDFYKFSAQLSSLEDVILFNHQVNLSYTNTFGKHNIDFVLANRFYRDNLWWRVDSMNNSLPEHYYLKNSMASYGPEGSVLRTMYSYIGNLSYNYRQAYFISAVANLSHVKEGLSVSYFALFPSVSLSWDLARESLLKNVKWLNSMALYVNWGQSGNYPLSGLANDLYERVSYTPGDSTVYYPAIKQFANHHLRHELTTETDYGIKSRFFNDRLSLNASYYTKSVSNLIVSRDIPYYYGGGKQYINVGRIAVTGKELTLELWPIRNTNLSWQINFNYASSSQIVKKIYEDQPLVYTSNDILQPEFVIKEGQPLGNIYGYKILGKWTKADRLANNKLYFESSGMKYLDGDTTDQGHTKTVIGNSIPKSTWNLENTIRYKNFSLEFSWYAVWGVQKYNATRAATIMTGVNREVNSFIYDSLYTITDLIFYQSSIFIEDASFIRLKTLSLDYSPEKTLFDKARLTFSVSFENLITFTKYKGYDPEAAIFTDNNFSDNAIDRGAYPNPKAMYVSVDVKF